MKLGKSFGPSEKDKLVTEEREKIINLKTSQKNEERQTVFSEPLAKEDEFEDGFDKNSIQKERSGVKIVSDTKMSPSNSDL